MIYRIFGHYKLELFQFYLLIWLYTKNLENDVIKYTLYENFETRS